MRNSPESQISYLGINVPPLPKSDIPILTPNLGIFPTRDSYVWLTLTHHLESTVQGLSHLSEEAQVRAIEPPAGVNADLAIATYSMAKQLRQDPNQIAQALTKNLNGTSLLPDLVEQAVAQGAYLNFILDTDRFGLKVLQEVEQFGDDYGNINLGNGEKVVIDCSSPNVAKYMSVGHLRSTVIGESLARINQATGYTVIRDNHLGDWGTQFGMLARAYELWGNDYEELREGVNPVQGLYKLYVRIHDEVEKEKAVERVKLGDPKADPETSLEREGRDWFKRLESGDTEALKLLSWATEQSLKEFQGVYDLLGTKYEYTLGESFYIGMLPEVIRYLQNRSIATTDERGVLSVDFKSNQLNRLGVQKSDGTSLYATRDLAALVARKAWFDPQRILYVVGADQKEYFQQLFATFDKMTDNQSPKLEHVSFGMIQLPEGKMSTRAGRVVFLAEVLEEAIARAEQKTTEVSKNLSPEEKERVARQVGVGAVTFFDLGQGRERNIKFDWEKALSFEGYSSPYIQYAHARAQALLRRAAEESIDIRDDIPVTLDLLEERELAKHLAKLPLAITKAQTTNRPSNIAEYVYQAADFFSSFYREAGIFNEPNADVKNSRLRLTHATAQVIRNGLNLLCIEAPEKM